MSRYVVFSGTPVTEASYPSSNEFIAFISSSEISKSKISKFSFILYSFDDFGIGITPLCICHLNTICAMVFLYFSDKSV